MLAWESLSRALKMSTTSTITKTVKKPAAATTVGTPSPSQQKTLDTTVVKEKEKEKMEMTLATMQNMFATIQETLLRTQEKMAENQEEMRSLHTEIRNEIGEVRGDIQNMNDRIGDIQQSLTENERRIRNAEAKIETVETKVEKMEQKTAQINKELSDSLAVLEMEKASYFLRFQNISEEKDEDLEGKMSEIIAEITDIDKQEIQQQIEEIYRVQTNYIRRHRLAREVHVKFSKRSIRDEVYMKSRGGTLTYKGKEIIILKQIPRRIRNQRQQFQFLTNKLNRHKIAFRWLIPEGILVTWEEKKYKLDTLEKAREFYDTHFNQADDQDSKEELESRSQEETLSETSQEKEVRTRQDKERGEREGARTINRMETRNTKKQLN